MTCPVVTRDPAGNCANQVTWNTSVIAPGTYWIIAVNNDPPFHVYYSSNAPIRVEHGGTPPAGGADRAARRLRRRGTRRYHLQWLADGKAPLTFDARVRRSRTRARRSCRRRDSPRALMPAPNADGTFGYDWDVSGLDTNKAYWVRLTVTDGDGNSTFTDSHFATTIFHSGAMTPRRHVDGDAAEEERLRDRRRRSAGVVARRAVAGAVIGALAIALYVARRAARRG